MNLGNTVVPGLIEFFKFCNIKKNYCSPLLRYQANLNIDGSGAVVAAPDKATPGGSYYYHWMRDAGLSIKAWLDINDNDLEKVEEILTAYAGWVKKVQGKTDPNDIDVRIGKG